MSSTIFGSLSGMPDKKTEQLGFKVDAALFDKVAHAAKEERRKRNEFARLLFEWAFVKYEESGSYDALTGRAVKAVVPSSHSQLQLPHVPIVQPGAGRLSIQKRAKDHGKRKGRKRKDKRSGDASA